LSKLPYLLYQNNFEHVSSILLIVSPVIAGFSEIPLEVQGDTQLQPEKACFYSLSSSEVLLQYQEFFLYMQIGNFNCLLLVTQWLA